MNAVSRRCEFRTDCFTAEPGYDQELKFFLERFDAKTEKRQLSLGEVLYAMHLPAQTRLLKIEGIQQK